MSGPAGGSFDSGGFAAKMSSINAGATQGGGGGGGSSGALGQELGAGQLNAMAVNSAIEGSTAISIMMASLGVKGLEKCFSFMNNTSAGLMAGIGLSSVGIFSGAATSTAKTVASSIGSGPGK